MTTAVEALTGESVPVRSAGLGRQALRRLVRQPVTLAAFAVLVAILVVGELAPVLAPQGWNAFDLSPALQNQPPSFAHLFGTNQIGIDIAERVVWAIHFSEQTAVIGGLAATLLALLAGLIAGFYGGWLDAAVMRFADFVAAFPVLVLLLILFGVVWPVSQWDATVIFALAMWPFAARVLRARVASLHAEEFVHAALALGASDRRIIFRHLLPNAAGAIVVSVTSLIGQILLIEATAEFFGLGIVSVTRPTLGNLIGESVQSGIGSYNRFGLGWWTWVPPAAVLVLMLGCLNLIGDGLDVAFNPRRNAR